MISLDPEWDAIIGLIVTIVLGFGVGCLIQRVGKSIGPLSPPTEEVSKEWKALVEQHSGGFWISFVERPMFFIALWVSGAWPILSTWLVFKLAFYWQGTNFMAFPEQIETKDQVKNLIAKRQLGLHQVATSLVGTGANILLALIGVAVGKWIILP